jgi:adenylate cyclase
MSAGINGELIPQGGGDAIPLLRERLTVGRRESCDICLRFPNISGQHCELMFRDGYWSIRDLNSTNGIKVNEQRVLQKPLRPGDEVTIGKRKYTIQYTLPSAGQMALEEVLNEGEDILSQSLLEKAGLQSPRRRDEDDD